MLSLKDELLVDIRVFKAPELAQKILLNHQEWTLCELVFEKNPSLSSRAMWVVSQCSDIDHKRVKRFEIKFIENLKNDNLHDGVIRNTLRLFQKHPVPKKSETFLLDKCYEYIKNPSVAIAIRAFAITVVFNISKPYPELLNELQQVIHHMSISEEGPGIRSRIKNISKAIQKIRNQK